MTSDIHHQCWDSTSDFPAPSIITIVIDLAAIVAFGWLAGGVLLSLL